ncbi:MAG: hypothetical protein H8E60_04090 [Candidatus Marinimicrobia bacterium]|nr:hypothetical protein [Candidatus Neomarinimicrobiota bacterium]
MNEIENKTNLKKLLINKTWEVKQFQPENEFNKIEVKTLFENMPGILIFDFFKPNLINELTILNNSPLEIQLITTGIDDVIWTYNLKN